MSPNTLYREGTDLDELLAELDDQFPGQVQVLEITHPREGGVLGFFAKQRVGVHYRLAGSEPAPDSFVTALAAARAQAEDRAAIPLARDGGGDALGDADVPPGVAAAAAVIAREVAAETRSAAAAQAVVDDVVLTTHTRLGPDPETLAAALAGRAATAPRDTTPDSFAALLAGLAAKRPVARPVARTAPAAPRAEAAPRAAAAAAEADPLAADAHPAAAVSPQPAFTLNHAAPRSAEPSRWQPSVRLSLRGENAPAPSPRDPYPGADTGSPHVDTVASTRNDQQAGRSPETRRRSAPLSWPLAQPAPGDKDATPQIAVRHDESRGPGGDLSHGAAPGGFSTPHAGASTMLLSRPTRTDAETSLDAAPGPVPAPSRATPLALRRQLLEVGVPVDRVPVDAVHVYAAIEQVTQALPPAPVAPSRPGEILVVVGAARDVVTAAEAVVANAATGFTEIWTFGCPAAVGTRRIPTVGSTALVDEAQARAVAATVRSEKAGPVLIVVATDTVAGRECAADVVTGVCPDAVWAAVDATRKPADVRTSLAAIRGIDALVVTHAEPSGSPATVWELDRPIALVDGRPSTGGVWAVLLLDRLAALAREDAACSGARF